MLFAQHACRQGLLVIVAQHRYRRLNDDRPVVEVAGDEMHRAAVYLHPVLQCAGVGVQAAVGR